ncbi:lamin tail domain-containing protein, partial [Patescibacteria group bacterium]|nr:lamin tail domain-containing protein [Patescibacteria group bacterium]
MLKKILTFIILSTPSVILSTPSVILSVAKDLIGTTLLFFLLTSPVFAGNDLTVTCSQSEEFGFCDTSPANIPLFSETDVKPGFNFYQNITVDTTSLEEEFCNLTIGTSKVSDPSGLGGVLVNQLRRDGSIIKEFTIADLSTPTFLETIPNNSTYIYNWKMTMKENAGNEFQGQNLSFDLLLNFSCGQEPEPTLTPTPVINPSGIILNELMPAPPDNQEWFEIYNTNSFPVVLENWQYDDLDAISSGAVRNLPIINIPAFGFYVIQAGGSYFNNGGDFVRLINQDGIEVDSFDYTSYSYIFSWSRQPDNSWCLTDPTKDDANNLCPSDDGPTPTSPPSPPTCDDEKPNTPTGLFATDIGNGQVSLIWNPVVTPPPFTYYLLAYGPS